MQNTKQQQKQISMIINCLMILTLFELIILAILFIIYVRSKNKSFEITLLYLLNVFIISVTFWMTEIRHMIQIHHMMTM